MKRTLLALIICCSTACSSLDKKQKSEEKAFAPTSRAGLDQVFLEAQLYIFAGNLSKSRAVLEQSLKQDLPVASAIEFERMLARVEESSGMSERAYERLDDLHRRFPENVAVLADLAQFLYGVQLKDQAFVAYSQLTELAPEHSNYWIYKGLLALELSKLKEAWNSFDHLIKRSEDAKHLGHLYMGKLLQMTNFSKRAENAFRKCLQIEDEAKECALELASHIQKLGRSKEAFLFLENYVARHDQRSSVPVLKKLLEWSLASGNENKISYYVESLERLRPSDVSLKRRAALIFLRRGDLQSAKERMQIVLQDKSSNVQDISNYLRILNLDDDASAQEKFLNAMILKKRMNEQLFFKKFNIDKSLYGEKKAKRILKDSCSLNPLNMSPCSYVYSFVLLESGQVKKSRKNLVKLIARRPQGMLKHKYFLSQIYLKEGEEQKSMTVLDSILIENSAYSPALNFKAYRILKSGKSLKEAEALSLRALAVQPRNGHYLDTYGWILFKKKLYREAVAVLSQAFQIEPDEPEISEHLADAFAALGDSGKAEKFYKLASQLYKGENINRVEKKIAIIQKNKRNISSTTD